MPVREWAAYVSPSMEVKSSKFQWTHRRPQRPCRHASSIAPSKPAPVPAWQGARTGTSMRSLSAEYPDVCLYAHTTCSQEGNRSRVCQFAVRHPRSPRPVEHRRSRRACRLVGASNRGAISQRRLATSFAGPRSLLRRPRARLGACSPLAGAAFPSTRQTSPRPYGAALSGWQVAPSRSHRQVNERTAADAGVRHVHRAGGIGLLRGSRSRTLR